MRRGSMNGPANPRSLLDLQEEPICRHKPAGSCQGFIGQTALAEPCRSVTRERFSEIGRRLLCQRFFHGTALSCERRGCLVAGTKILIEFLPPSPRPLPVTELPYRFRRRG